MNCTFSPPFIAYTKHSSTKKIEDLSMVINLWQFSILLLKNNIHIDIYILINIID